MSCPCPDNNTKKTEEPEKTQAPQSPQSPQSPKSPKSPCSTTPTGFSAFKQAVSDTGNAILCKTVRRDSDACKKRAEEAKTQSEKQDCGSTTGGGCCKTQQETGKDSQPVSKTSNPMEPKTKEEDWEFVRNLIDKS